MVSGIVLFVIAIKAQPPKPPTIEERLKSTNEVIQQEVQPTAPQKTAIELACKSFFIAAGKLRKDNPPSPPPDLKVKDTMDKLGKDRDEAVKKVLTETQYQKYKDAAKKLHPRKPGEPGGNDGPPPFQH